MQIAHTGGAPWRHRFAIGLVVTGLGILGPAAMAASVDTLPLAPGPGCGILGGAQLAAPAALRPALVRAERARPRRSKRPMPVAPRATPVPAPEPAAALLHAFYACAALPELIGPGWKAVGPMQHA